MYRILSEVCEGAVCYIGRCLRALTCLSHLLSHKTVLEIASGQVMRSGFVYAEECVCE